MSFLEDAAAFFAAGRQRSGKNKDWCILRSGQMTAETPEKSVFTATRCKSADRRFTIILSVRATHRSDYVALDLTSYRIYLENKEIILPESQCQIGNFWKNHEIVFHKKHFCVIIEVFTGKDDAHDISGIIEYIHSPTTLHCRRTGRCLWFDAGISRLFEGVL